MKKIILFSIVLLFSGFAGFSQATDDAGLWATFNIDKKVSDKFSLFATEEFRLRENFTRVNLFYTDLGVEYHAAKWLKASLSYRLIEKQIIDDSYSYRHRVMLDLTFKKKFGRLAISYRNRTQREVRNVQSSENGYLPEWYSRNKVAIKYDVEGKRIAPYIACELRYQIHNPRMVDGDGLWSRARYVAGFDFKVNDKNTLGAYYLIQKEWNIAAPQNLWIVGVEYSISLD
jgi:hypothetical protein